MDLELSCEKEKVSPFSGAYTRPVVKRRFVDHGRWLASFADQFVVRCPRCGAAASVARHWDFAKRRWMVATAVCVRCGFSRRQQPADGCECGRCRRTVP